MGELPRDAILLVDANYWQQYNKGNRPHWPNRQRAQGLWSSLQTFTPALVPKVQELVHRFQADLESLTKEMFRLMEASLAEAEVAEVCDNLVSTQVLGISPDGQLCQYVLWNATFHSLEVGHQWGMVPIRNSANPSSNPGPLPVAASRGLNGEPGCGDTQAAAVLPLRAFCCVGCPVASGCQCLFEPQGHSVLGAGGLAAALVVPACKAEGAEPRGRPAVDPATCGLGLG